MIRFSLCMIVKNEAAVLDRILAPMKEIADEIIVVDTGSTDNTKEIAYAYTQNVFDFPWTGDFAAARNYACSKVSQEYWMWLDADDVISPGEQKKLRKLKETLDPSVDIVMMRYVTGFDSSGNPSFSYYRERLMKTNRGFQWEGAVHETVALCGNRFYSDISIEHRKKGPGDPDRNLRIYEAMLDRGETLTPRHQFYFARELFYHSRYPEAIETFQAFLQDPNGWLENKIDACLQLSYCYRYLGDADRQLAALFYSFRFDRPRAEICCEIGRIKLEEKRYQEAIYWYEQALGIKPAAHSGAFIQNDCYDYIPYIQLCICYDKLSDYGKAWEYHIRAMTIKPDSPAVLQNQRYFERRLKECREAL